MFDFSLLQRLCEARGISGDEGAVRDLIIDEIKAQLDQDTRNHDQDAEEENIQELERISQGSVNQLDAAYQKKGSQSEDTCPADNAAGSFACLFDEIGFWEDKLTVIQGDRSTRENRNPPDPGGSGSSRREQSGIPPPSERREDLWYRARRGGCGWSGPGARRDTVP